MASLGRKLGAAALTQKRGSRQGERYVVKRGKSGRNVRVYESGETALAKAQGAKGVGSTASTDRFGRKPKAPGSFDMSTPTGDVATIAALYSKLLKRR